jgi:hypothetical protein
MKREEFIDMTDVIRKATVAAIDAGNEFSTPWRIIGTLTASLEAALYHLPKATREEMLKQLIDSLGYIERSYEKVENEVRKAA